MIIVLIGIELGCLAGLGCVGNQVRGWRKIHWPAQSVGQNNLRAECEAHESRSTRAETFNFSARFKLSLALNKVVVRHNTATGPLMISHPFIHPLLSCRPLCVCRASGYPLDIAYMELCRVGRFPRVLRVGQPGTHEHTDCQSDSAEATIEQAAHPRPSQQQQQHGRGGSSWCNSR